jgi:hypothetical protein
MNISSEGRTLFTVPRPELCQALQWSLATSRAMEALGLDPSELAPSPTRGGVDLRPQKFTCPWAAVSREGPGLYLVWSRVATTPEQVSDDYHADVADSSIYVGPPNGTSREEWEQVAGDAVILGTAIGTGAHGQALRQWLGLWGWKPPVKEQAAAVPQPMVT